MRIDFFTNRTFFSVPNLFLAYRIFTRTELLTYRTVPYRKNGTVRYVLVRYGRLKVRFVKKSMRVLIYDHIESINLVCLTALKKTYNINCTASRECNDLVGLNCTANLTSLSCQCQNSSYFNYSIGFCSKKQVFFRQQQITTKSLLNRSRLFDSSKSNIQSIVYGLERM